MKASIQKKGTTAFDFMYSIVNGILSTIIFLIIYNFVLKSFDQNFEKFVWIFISINISGLISGIFVYIWYKGFGSSTYGQLHDRTLSFYIRQFISSLIYSLLVFLLIIQFLINRASNYLEMVIYLAVVKILVYSIAEKVASYLTIGR